MNALPEEQAGHDPGVEMEKTIPRKRNRWLLIAVLAALPASCLVFSLLSSVLSSGGRITETFLVLEAGTLEPLPGAEVLAVYTGTPKKPNENDLWFALRALAGNMARYKGKTGEDGRISFNVRKGLSNPAFVAMAPGYVYPDMVTPPAPPGVDHVILLAKKE